MDNLDEVVRALTKKIQSKQRAAFVEFRPKVAEDICGTFAESLYLIERLQERFRNKESDYERLNEKLLTKDLYIQELKEDIELLKDEISVLSCQILDSCR